MVSLAVVHLYVLSKHIDEVLLVGWVWQELVLPHSCLHFIYKIHSVAKFDWCSSVMCHFLCWSTLVPIKHNHWLIILTSHIVTVYGVLWLLKRPFLISQQVISSIYWTEVHFSMYEMAKTIAYIEWHLHHMLIKVKLLCRAFI